MLYQLSYHRIGVKIELAFELAKYAETKAYLTINTSPLSKLHFLMQNAVAQNTGPQIHYQG